MVTTLEHKILSTDGNRVDHMLDIFIILVLQMGACVYDQLVTSFEWNAMALISEILDLVVSNIDASSMRLLRRWPASHVTAGTSVFLRP